MSDDELHGLGPCALCGRDPAAGFSSIGDKWYCHGDDEERTCYMRSQSAYVGRSVSPAAGQTTGTEG